MSNAVNTAAPNPPVEYQLAGYGEGTYQIRGNQKINVSDQSFLLVPGSNGLHELRPYTAPAPVLKRDPDAKEQGPKFTTRPDGTMLRIIAARDIEDNEGTVVVEEGEEGGLIHDAHALAQSGRCWVDQGAKITGGNVREDAQIGDEAVVSGGMIFGNARVTGDAQVHSGNVFGNAIITDSAIVRGGNVFEEAVFSGKAVVEGGEYKGVFQADSGKFGAGRYEGPSLAFGRIVECDDDEDDDNDYDGRDWAAEILRYDHLLAVATRFGTLTVYRTRHKRTAQLGYRLQVGCQIRRLGEVEGLALTHSANDVEIAMVPGFVAMATVIVKSWGVEP